jgi:hypothetical protein
VQLAMGDDKTPEGALLGETLGGRGGEGSAPAGGGNAGGEGRRHVEEELRPLFAHVIKELLRDAANA